MNIPNFCPFFFAILLFLSKLRNRNVARQSSVRNRCEIGAKSVRNRNVARQSSVRNRCEIGAKSERRTSIIGAKSVRNRNNGSGEWLHVQITLRKSLFYIITNSSAVLRLRQPIIFIMLHSVFRRRMANV